MEEYKQKLIEVFKEGLLLVFKYGLLIGIIWYAYNFSLQTRQMAENGSNAAAAVVQFQSKGWLPKFDNNGQIPTKIEEKREDKALTKDEKK